jgi:DNA polymerase-4
VILFAEVPSFYAEVERLRDPGLRGRPVIVGGDPRKRGRVQSVSPEAAAAGVEAGMPMQEAIERCPEARAVKTDMQHYREVAGRLRGCFRAEVDAVETVSLESAYLDVSLSNEDASVVGERLITRVRETLGLPLRLGLAPVKFLARLAAEEAPRGGCFRVAAGAEADFLAPLSVARLPGVGPKTLEALAGLGATTVGDLRRLERGTVERGLGNRGLRILEMALGEAESVVRGHSHPHSLSREHTFRPSEHDWSELWDCLQELSRLLGEALQEQLLSARRVGVKVRFDDQQTTTRSKTLGSPVVAAADIYAVAVSLLDRTDAGGRAVRVLGVSVAGLGPRPEDRQLDLFS